MEDKNLPFLPFDPKRAIQLIGRGPSRCVRDPRIKAWWISTAVFNPETDILEDDLVWNVHKDSLQEVWFKELPLENKRSFYDETVSFFGEASTVDHMLQHLAQTKNASIWVFNGIDFEDETESRKNQAESFWFNLGVWLFFSATELGFLPSIFFLKENEYQALNFGTYPPEEGEEPNEEVS